MSEAVVAKRYADALFQLGNEKATIESLMEELRIIKEVLHSNKQFYTFLKHPRVTNGKKEKFLDDVFRDFSNDVVNIMKLLVERHRVEFMPSIIDYFIGLVNEAKGIAEAKVYSVRELSGAEKEKFETTFAKRLNKQAIKLESIVDPSVIGGIKLRVGNTIYDGTISGKLKRIEQNIVTVN